MRLIDKLFPFWVPSKELWNIEIGQVFRDNIGYYRLLYRDAFKAKVVESNWWTDLWWGGKIGNRSKTTD